MNTIGEAVSRVRNIVKAANTDAFVTDRMIYSLIQKYAKMYIKRQDSLTSRAKFGSLFKALPCLDLIEVDKIEACCNVQSGCKIMRTEKQLPGVLEGPQGPLLRSVSSCDSFIEVYRTTPPLYSSMQKTSSFKYNTKKYYWFMNGYLYIPNVEWPAVRVEGIFDTDLGSFTCDDPCIQMQDQTLNIPPELFAEVEKQVMQDFAFLVGVPMDQFISDKQSNTR